MATCILSWSVALEAMRSRSTVYAKEVRYGSVRAADGL